MPSSWWRARYSPCILQVLLKPFAGFFQVLFGCGGGEVGGIRTLLILRPCRKHWYLQCFRLFVQDTAQRMWNKTRCHHRPCLSQPCPKHWYLRVFSSLYNILHKDVEQGKLSQASMPLATRPKTLVFTAFLFLYVLRAAESGLTQSIPETETPEPLNSK